MKPEPAPSLPLDSVERAAEMYGRGRSLKSVGEEFGVDAKTIRRALARERVAIRPRPGWTRST